MTALQTQWVSNNPIDPRVLSSYVRSSAVPRAPQERVLVIEHQPVVAVDIAQAFEAEGAQVVGVASRADTALALIADVGPLDGVVLDLDLRGGTAFSVADELARRGIPFLFLASGDASDVPERFAHVTRCEKPLDVGRLVPLVLGQEVQRNRSEAPTMRRELDRTTG